MDFRLCLHAQHDIVLAKCLHVQQKDAFIQFQYVYFRFVLWFCRSCVRFSEITQCSELMGMKIGFKQKQSL